MQRLGKDFKILHLRRRSTVSVTFALHFIEFYYPSYIVFYFPVDPVSTWD
jgi:hypothetical protein